MTKQNKLSREIEENIQNLAGDIYVQIEDKITSILANYAENIEIDTIYLQQHPDFKRLSADNKQLQRDIDNLNIAQKKLVSSLTSEKEQLQSTLIEREQELDNHAKLNTAKLTDTEQALKEKLADNSELSEQLSTLTAKYAKSEQALGDELNHLDAITKEHSALQAMHTILDKNDKAKAATLSVQNQQISELQLKHEQVSSELEYTKAEQEKVAKSNLENLTSEQQQAFELKTSLENLQQQNLELQASIEALNITNEKAEKRSEQLEISLQKSYQENEQSNLKLEKQAVEIVRLTSALYDESISRETSDKNVSTLTIAFDDLQSRFDKSTQLFDLEKQKAKNENTLLGEEVETGKLALERLTKSLAQEQLQVKSNISDIQTLDVQKENLTQENHALKKQVTEFEQQTFILTKELNEERLNVEHSENRTQQLISDHEIIMTQSKQQSDEMITAHTREIESCKRELQEVNAQCLEEKSKADIAVIKLEQNFEEQKNILETEQTKHQKLQLDYQTLDEENSRKDVKLNEAQKQTLQLETEVEKQKYITLQNHERVQDNKNKQEVEYNKARETIKYLRDENTELNRKLVQEVNELEDKLTEYRLRFEYAQKQLTKMSK